jgi:hypothetical protein
LLPEVLIVCRKKRVHNIANFGDSGTPDPTKSMMPAGTVGVLSKKDEATRIREKRSLGWLIK